MPVKPCREQGPILELWNNYSNQETKENKKGTALQPKHEESAVAGLILACGIRLLAWAVGALESRESSAGGLVPKPYYVLHI